MRESSFLLTPKSIAIIGAKEKEGSIGHAITSNILKDYKGSVFAVNPNVSAVLGKKTYKSILDVPEEIDLAVIAVKNTIVPAVLEECGKKKVRVAVVISAGFKEVGQEGEKLEQRLISISKKIWDQIDRSQLSWYNES